MSDRYRLYGVLASPYAAKLRALFRYRRIPFDWVPASFDWAPDFQLVRPELSNVQPRIIPIVRYPQDQSYHTDSTFIALDLEQHVPGSRSVVPPDPGLAFLSNLIDDFGDEWGVKIAFQYRWGNEHDRNLTNRAVMAELLGGGVPQATICHAAEQFRDRQVSRMPLVGATPLNAPAIEASYARVLDAISGLRERQAFLFGGRPSLGDFGLFGALFTCRNDPTPGEIMRQRSPGTLDWIYVLDEASGVEGDWIGEPSALPRSVTDLLSVVGDFYLPFLEANAAACEKGEKMVELELLGLPYRQGTFRYQAKCLHWLRDQWRALDAASKRRIEPLLEESGCLRVLSA